MLDPLRPDRERGYALASGIHFAVVQNALYLSIGLFINFSLLGYFVIVLSWLLGSVFGLNPAFRKFSQSAVSLGCTVTVVLFSHWISGSGLIANMGTWIVVEAVAVVAGIQAGTFFGKFENHKSVSTVLWHENNGFVLGIILSLLAFTDYGVRFLFWGPVATWMVVFCLHYLRALIFFVPLSVVLLVLTPFGLPVRYFILSLVAIGLKLIPDGKPHVERTGAPISPAQARYLLLGCGFCLILLQTMVVRQFSGLLSACEISILLVSASFLVGYSVAYRLEPYLSWDRVSRWAPALFAVQIIYLCFGNAIFATVAAFGFSYLAVMWLFLLLSFSSAALFAIVLPLVLSHRLGLAVAYRWELTGSAAAVAACLMAQMLNVPAVFPLFLFCASLVVMRLSPPAWIKPLGAACLLVFSLVTWKGEVINRFNKTVYYTHRTQSPISMRYSSSNFYHQIDVIESPGGERQAFLNGVRYFGNYGLNEFTFYLAELPARLAKPQKTLILGAGSLTSIRRVAPHTKEITVVEIDPEVAAVSESHFSEYNQLGKLAKEGVNFKLVFDDARHFLRVKPDKYDLIIFDISAPYYLQTASLHTLEFFELIRSRLTERGVFSISTSGSVSVNLGRRVASTVAQIFPAYQLLSIPGVNGFLYGAPKSIPWNRIDVVPAIQSALGMVPNGTALYVPEDLKPILAAFDPLSLKNMSVLLNDNVQRIQQRLQ